MRTDKQVPKNTSDPEKEYYKKKLDELSGMILRLNYELGEQTNTIHQFKKGYEIIAKLHKLIGTTQDISVIYNEIIVDLFFYLQMDRTAVLIPSRGNGNFIPAYIKGFPENNIEQLYKIQIQFPESIFANHYSIIANSETLTDDFISYIKSEFGAPYFILTPVVVNNEIISFIYGGRLKEVSYIGYTPLDKSYAETFEAIAGFVAAWIKELKRNELINNERLRISKDMHDEIGANLTRISLLSEIIKTQKNADGETALLNQISDSIKETIENLDEIVWAVNPSNDNLKNLIAYIVEYAEAFFSLSDIKCRFNIPHFVPELMLPSEKRHNFFLVVKEALNNVQKYSEAEYVVLTLFVDDTQNPKSFKFIIKDNGKGFDLHSIQQSSNGIKNMRDRILAANGDFEINTNPGAGTEICMTVFSSEKV